MPRYLRVADVPAILEELKGVKGTPYQLDVWQKRWCEIKDEIDEDVAVLSYRWRIRGANETLDEYKSWLSDCGKEGYSTVQLRAGSKPVDWTLVNDNPMQIEVAAWLLWLYTNSTAKLAWVDQMCVPQDASLEEKMGHIKDSPAIYRSGKVYVVLAPVVDYISGRIMSASEARSLVKGLHSDMEAYLNMPSSRSAPWRGWMGSPAALSRSAVKSLLVNNSYMRRIWTIQEAVAATDLNVWPLLGHGELNSFQSLAVMDWPEFNAWNSHPGIGAIVEKYGDKAFNDYRDGDYTEIIQALRSHPPDAIGYLAMLAKELMWSTMDRNGLINDLRRASTPAHRAFVLLNNHQVHSALSFLPEDHVLALVPLVDYPAWKAATRDVKGAHLVQASVVWAYDIMMKDIATWKWSMRIYNHPRCTAGGLELLQPRRNLTNGSSMHGTLPGEQAMIPAAGGSVLLMSPPPPPPSHPPAVVSYLEESGALSAEPLSLTVEASFLMPHAGWGGNWGENCWKFVRDALTTDENFRLAVQWSLEPWREQEGLDKDRCVAVVLSGDGLPCPNMVLLAVRAGEETPTTGQVMAVIDVAPHLLKPLVAELDNQCLGKLAGPITAVSVGVLPPPPPPPQPVCEPAATEPEWTVVSLPPATPEVEEAEEAQEGEPAGAEAEGEGEPAAEEEAGEEEAAPQEGGAEAPDAPLLPSRPASASSKPASRPPSARPESAASRRPPSARPASGAGQRPPSARPASAVPEVTPAEEAGEALPSATLIQKGEPAPGVATSGMESAAGAKYAGHVPVAQGNEGPCKGCVVS